jgi:hypothetical protein
MTSSTVLSFLFAPCYRTGTCIDWCLFLPAQSKTLKSLQKREIAMAIRKKQIKQEQERKMTLGAV